MSSSSSQPSQPPPPPPDFDFAFDPALQNFVPPPPLPSSADLFSPTETTNLFGFLDNFSWEFDNESLFADSGNINASSSSAYDNVSYSSGYLPPIHEPSTTYDPSSLSETSRRRATVADISTDYTAAPPENRRTRSQSQSVARSTYASTSPPATANASDSKGARTKPLLTSPQKRLNHIMSEQKRRNAIRDGYAQLITLLAPNGASPGVGMPTRGRPKGSGSRGKGRTQGKSGILFRAVEYCKWLEEGRDALRDEVSRLEAAAGIQHHER